MDTKTGPEVGSNDELGLLPERANLPPQIGRLLKPGQRFGQPVYSAQQMHAYAAQQVAAERERWESALRKTSRLIDPLRPEGQPGSYARGNYNGIATALETLRANLGPNAHS